MRQNPSLPPPPVNPPSIETLLRRLLNKAHTVGQDDYREGANDRSLQRHDEELDAAREEVIEAINALRVENAGLQSEIARLFISEAVIPYVPAYGIVGNPEMPWRTRALYAEEKLIQERIGCDAVGARYEQELKSLKEQVVWGFRGDEIPQYTQGSKGEHEITEPITAEEANGLVKTIVGLREELLAVKKDERQHWTDFEKKAVKCKELREELADLRADFNLLCGRINEAVKGDSKCSILPHEALSKHRP